MSDFNTDVDLVNDTVERECRILATQHWRLAQSYQQLADDLKELRTGASVSTAMGDDPSEVQPKGSSAAEARPISALRGALRDARKQTDHG